jgi:hypothetical protein
MCHTRRIAVQVDHPNYPGSSYRFWHLGKKKLNRVKYAAPPSQARFPAHYGRRLSFEEQILCMYWKYLE